MSGTNKNSCSKGPSKNSRCYTAGYNAGSGNSDRKSSTVALCSSSVQAATCYGKGYSDGRGGAKGVAAGDGARSSSYPSGGGGMSNFASRTNIKPAQSLIKNELAVPNPIIPKRPGATNPVYNKALEDSINGTWWRTGPASNNNKLHMELQKKRFPPLPWEYILTLPKQNGLSLFRLGDGNHVSVKDCRTMRKVCENPDEGLAGPHATVYIIARPLKNNFCVDWYTLVTKGLHFYGTQYTEYGVYEK